MPKFRVPVRVNVAPVQTYEKTRDVFAASRVEAAQMIRDNLLLSLKAGGWKAAGRLQTLRPERTPYDVYLDEEALDRWVSKEG